MICGKDLRFGQAPQPPRGTECALENSRARFAGSPIDALSVGLFERHGIFDRINSLHRHGLTLGNALTGIVAHKADDITYSVAAGVAGLGARRSKTLAQLAPQHPTKVELCSPRAREAKEGGTGMCKGHVLRLELDGLQTFGYPSEIFGDS